MKFKSTAKASIVTWGLLALSTAHASQSVRLLELRSALAPAMHECESAYTELAIEVSGPRNLTTMVTGAAFTKDACDAAQEAIIDLGRLEEGSIEAKYAVSRWLSQERQVALYHRNFANKAQQYASVLQDASYSTADKRRLLGEILDFMGEDAVKDRERKNLVAVFFEKAQSSVANDQEQPLKAIKLAPTKIRRVFDAFILKLDATQMKCESSYNGLNAFLSSRNRSVELAIAGKQTHSRCTEAVSKLKDAKAPSTLGKDAREWLDEWIMALSDATSNRADAGQAIMWFAETGSKGHIDAFRSDRMAVIVKSREAEDALIEAKRAMGQRLP